jgi:hypothetical protein
MTDPRKEPTTLPEDAPSRTGRWPAEVAHLPVCPHRDLPIPFIAEIGPDGVGNFGVLDAERHRQCLEGRLCGMCGRHMPGEVALLAHEELRGLDSFTVEPPVHERCAEIALGGLCPFIARERVPRRPVGEGITVIGDAEELPEVGRTIAKPPMVITICSDYQQANFITGGGPMPVYLARGVQRVRRYAWVGGLAAEVQQQPERRTVRTQPRRTAPRSKRSSTRRHAS